MASGDGVITKAGWCGGGGNCVKINTTGHIKQYMLTWKIFLILQYQEILSKGKLLAMLVQQVCSGPHLHYEVIENGKKINSQKLKLPPGKSLEGINRKQFEIVRIKTDVLKSDLVQKF